MAFTAYRGRARHTRFQLWKPRLRDIEMHTHTHEKSGQSISADLPVILAASFKWGLLAHFTAEEAEGLRGQKDFPEAHRG